MKLTKLASSFCTFAVGAAFLFAANDAQAFTALTLKDKDDKVVASVSGLLYFQSYYYRETLRTSTFDKAKDEKSFEKEKNCNNSQRFRYIMSASGKLDDVNSLKGFIDGDARNTLSRTYDFKVDEKGQVTSSREKKPTKGRTLRLNYWYAEYGNTNYGKFQVGKYNNVVGYWSWSGWYGLVLSVPDALVSGTTYDRQLTWLSPDDFGAKGLSFGASIANPSRGVNNYSWGVGYKVSDKSDVKYLGQYTHTKTFDNSALTKTKGQQFNEVQFNTEVGGVELTALAQAEFDRTNNKVEKSKQTDKNFHVGFGARYAVPQVSGLSVYGYAGATKSWSDKQTYKTAQKSTQGAVVGVNYNQKVEDWTVKYAVEAGRARTVTKGLDNSNAKRVYDNEVAVLLRLSY